MNLIRKFSNHNLEVISVDDINLQKIAAFDKIIFSPGHETLEPEGVMKKILNKYVFIYFAFEIFVIMSDFFGTISKSDCLKDFFYGTSYY